MPALDIRINPRYAKAANACFAKTANGNTPVKNARVEAFLPMD